MFPLTTTATRTTPDGAQHTYAGVIAYPTAGQEGVGNILGRVVEAVTLHLPHDDDATARDRFTLGDDAREWLVDGIPDTWPIKERGWDQGTVVHLARIYAHLPDVVQSEAFEGEGAYGPTFSEAQPVRCLVDGGIRDVVGPSGDVTSATGTVYAPVEAAPLLAVHSHLTLPDGRVVTVVALSVHPLYCEAVIE